MVILSILLIALIHPEVFSVFVARLAACYLHPGCSRSKRRQCFLASWYHADHSPSSNARSLDSCCMSHTHMAYSIGKHMLQVDALPFVSPL